MGTLTNEQIFVNSQFKSVHKLGDAMKKCESLLETLLFREKKRLQMKSYLELKQMPSLYTFDETTNEGTYCIEIQIDKRIHNLIRVMIEISKKRERSNSLFIGKSTYFGKRSDEKVIESKTICF